MLTFPGVKRRFSEKIVADMTVVDDYAHHPAEIKATIDGARQNIQIKKLQFSNPIRLRVRLH